MLRCSLFVTLLCVVFLSVGQTVQWNQRLLLADPTQVANDSTEKGRLIFRSRMFLLDSIEAVSKKTGIPFFDNAYRATFSNHQQVTHLLINFRNAARLIYYIRLFDEQGGAHMVYDYGAIHPCVEQTDLLLLTIAQTSYKVTAVEIGTYLGKDDVIKIGISNERDINLLIADLLSQRQKALCIKTSFFSDKELLSSAVNSATDEVKPLISADGKTLYFHRQNFKGNIGGKKDDQDIYVSKFSNAWSAAENLKAPLNDNLPNGIAAVSTSETTLFLINEYLGANQQRQGLSSSEKTISGWSFPKKIEVKDFYNRSEYIDYFISPTQNEMILAIQRDDSYGDQDLYVSFFDDATATWSAPLNIGSEVNTILSEASPFLAADGKTLYLASNGGFGYGGFDIYVTHRLDDSWTKWSVPENLGPIVNSSHDDLYYSVSAAGDQAYFVSTQDNDRNIFRMALPTIYKPEPVVLLSGKIFNAATALPEKAEVRITYYNESEIIASGQSDPLTGEYKIVLPAGGLYNYNIEKEGFKSVKGVISTLETKTYEEKQKNILVQTSDKTPGEIVIQLPKDSLKLHKLAVQQASDFAKTFLNYKMELSARDSTQMDLLREVRQRLISDGVRQRRITIQPSLSDETTLKLLADSLVHVEDDVVPSHYTKPVRSKKEEVSIMLRGRLIDMRTLKPLDGRLLFKIDGKVKSRAVSDPLSGKFQAVVPAGIATTITMIKDSVSSDFHYNTPESKQYAEFQKLILLNADTANHPRFEIGTDISTNRDTEGLRKWHSVLKKKKISRQVFSLQNADGQWPERFVNDLDYVSEILSNADNISATIMTHTSSKVKDANFEDEVAANIIQYFKTKGVLQSQISVKKNGSTQPKHDKKKNHSNTRVDMEIVFETSIP